MLLDEAVYQSLPESKKALYLHQWLQGLPQVISDTPKVIENKMQQLNTWCTRKRPTELLYFSG